MALLFSEEFETTVGSPPVGWTAVNNNPLVTTTGYHANGCNLSGGCRIRHTVGGSVTSASLFYVCQGGGMLFQAEQQVVSGTTTSFAAMLKCKFGSDNQLIVTDPNDAVFCFGNAAFSYQGEQQAPWTFIQLDLTLANTTIGTASAISVACVARINGEIVGTGTTTYLSTASAYYDNLLFGETAGGAAFVDSIYQYDAVAAAPIVTPNNGTPKARVSQAVIEDLRLQDDADARVSQALIEHIQLPTSANARVSQAVIELIMAGGSGWNVYEA